MAVELTIEQAKKAPQNFLYIYASDQFLAKLDNKTASVLRSKAANQRKVLVLSADKYKTTYKAYTDAIRSAFIGYYGMTPAKALVTLANGGEVAGKNWAKGVYGIGAVKRNDFQQNSGVTVDEKTGHIYYNGSDVTASDGVVYGNVRGKTFPTNYSAIIDGNTYTSQYNKVAKKYYAGSYSTSDGTMQNANGKTIDASDSSSVWENIILGLSEFITWLISLFKKDSDVELISASNTLPSQSDGFVTASSGVSVSNSILIAAIAVGALLFGTKSKGGRKKK